MAEPPHPEQWPVILNPGEWNFIGTLTAPPSSGQIRLDNAAQTSATKMWVHKLTATGSDASTALAGIEKGMEVTIANKSDAAKTQTYAVVADPINNSGYVELPVLWQRGGGSAIPAQRTVLTVTVVSTSVSAPVTGNQMAALTSPPTELRLPVRWKELHQPRPDQAGMVRGHGATGLHRQGHRPQSDWQGVRVRLQGGRLDARRRGAAGTTTCRAGGGHHTEPAAIDGAYHPRCARASAEQGGVAG
jgi:hypothetical protein